MNLAIIGSALSGGAIQIIDIINGDRISCSMYIYDDNNELHGKDVLGVPIIGAVARAKSDYISGKIDAAVIAVGSILPRKRLFDEISATGIKMCNIISSLAVVSSTAKIGVGNILLPFVYLGPNVKIKDNNFITTGTQINHDSTLGSNCYFSAGVTVAGRVKIGNAVRADTAASVTADAVVVDGSILNPGVSFGPIRGA